MQRHIKLADIGHIPTPPHADYPPALRSQGRTALAARGLRYDNATGRLYDNESGLLEQYTNQKDHTPHASLEDVMEWEFSRYIYNSASRLARGYSA